MIGVRRKIMAVLWILLGLLALFALVLVGNAVRVRRRARPLGPKPAPVPRERQQQYAQGLGEMVRCATVSRKGKPHEDAEFARLRAAVERLFPTFHARAEKRTFSDDCWVYRLPGKDNSRRVMLMSHHDVVAAGGTWAHPPFAGEVADGRVWGRGTVDTKGPLYAEFQALEELLQSGWTPPCDVYLASSHNEEYAGDGIPLAVEYFKQRGEDFALILDEGGAVIAPPLPGVSCKCAMLAVHEKGRCALTCTAADGASHGGLAPKKETPVVRLSRFIAAVSQKPPFIKRLYPEVRAMFEALCPYMSFPLRLVFANLWCFGPLIVRLMPALNPQAGAMVGTQCAFTDIATGEKDGGKACTARAFLRCVDGEDLQRDMAAFTALAGRFGVEVAPGDERDWHAPADMSRPGFGAVKQCVEACFPHTACAPFLLPAGTDARHFTDICPCVIRFAPIDIDPQQFSSVHGPDENLGVEALAGAVDFYKYFLTHGLEQAVGG